MLFRDRSAGSRACGSEDRQLDRQISVGMLGEIFFAWGESHCTEVGREDNYAILSVELHVRGRYKQKEQKKERESKKNACGDIEKRPGGKGDGAG
jgi:hypothetical protein